MAVYIYTGKLGGGKTLCAIGRIKEKLQSGCTVATNVDINLVKMCSVDNKDVRILRVPDKPKIEDLKSIGIGNTSYDESKNGLLVLDECGTWFNSRNWNDKARKPVNDWFLHARKLGWDVILIIQNISLLDSQARDALAEHTAFCSRMDRINIPFIGAFFKAFTGDRLPLPRLHMAKIVYGTSPRDLISDRHVYRGNDLFACYDTKQMFLDDYAHGVYSLLTPWHTRGRYLKEKDWRWYMKATRIMWKRFNRPFVAGVAALAASVMTYAATGGIKPIIAQVQPEPLQQEVAQDDTVAETLADKLEGYYYAGRMTLNRQTTYTFKAQGKPTLTSESIMLKGAAYRETSYCTIEIVKLDQSATIQCTDDSSTQI